MADTVRELVIKVSVEADTDDLKKVEQDQEAARTKSTALGTALGGLALKLADVAVQAAAAGLALAKDLVFGTAAAGDELVKTADKLKAPVEQIQRLQGAAELAGASSGDLTSGLRDLQKNIGEGFEKGTGPGIEALSTLGLSIDEVKTSLDDGDIEGALGLIGDAANDLDDPVRSNAALLKLMGGAGAELGVLLGQGTEGIKAAGDAIAETGVVINRDGLAKFESMQDASLLLEKQIEGFKNEIALGLAPALTDIATRIGDWIAENDEFITQDLPGILERVVETAIQAAEFTLETATAFREFARDAGDLIEILTEGDSLLGDVGEGMDILGNAASGAALGVLDLTESFLESIGAAEELIQIVREAKKELLGDNSGTTGERGAPGFAGGGTALVNPADAKAAESTGDTTKLRKIAEDPKFSDSDRAKASADADRIDERETAKAEEKSAKEAKSRTARIEANRKARADARAKAKAEADAANGGGGGGGGGGRRRGPAQPTVEELIGQVGAPGGASASALRSASSALSGTLVVNQITNNNFTNTVDVGGVRVSAAVAEVGPEVEAAITGTVGTALDRQNREAVQLIEARNNVGFG